jgi:transmembrane sensor
MDRRNIDWDLLDRYICGAVSAHERQSVELLMMTDTAFRAVVDGIRRVGNRDASAREADVAAAWTRFAVTMDTHRKGPLRLAPSSADSGAARSLKKTWMAAAGLAAAAVVIAAGALVQRVDRTEAPLIAASELATRRAELDTITLPSGIRVILGPESRLRIPERRDSAVHDVYLEGEAFFDVVHDEKRPFRVHTWLGTAEDLGTTFAVTAYPEAANLTVVVSSGKVALRRAVDSPPLATLSAGDVARVDSAGAFTLTRNANIHAVFAAAGGMLRLQGTALRDAIPRLERWYDVTILVRDSELLDNTVSGRFQVGSNRSALDALALTLEADVQWRADTVVLSRPLRRPEH